MLNATNWFAFGSWLPPREARESGRPLGKKDGMFCEFHELDLPETGIGTWGGGMARVKGFPKRLMR